MEVRDHARALRPLRGLGHRGVAFSTSSGKPIAAGVRAATERRGRPLLRHRRQALDQAVPAHRVETAQHGGPRHVPLAPEEHRELGQGVALVGVAARRSTRRRCRRRSAKPSCCTSRSRTSPEQASQPAELLPVRLGADRAAPRRTGQAQRAGGGWRPACRAAPRGPRRAGVPGSLSRRTANCRRTTAKASSPIVDDSATAVGPRSGEPGISWPTASRPGLELRQARRLEPAGGTELFDQRFERIEPFGLHLDLDPSELHGPLPGTHDDHGVVQRDLRRVDATYPQGERPASRPDLQHLAETSCADDGAQATSDRPVGTKAPQRPRREGLRSPPGAGAARYPRLAGCPSG